MSVEKVMVAYTIQCGGADERNLTAFQRRRGNTSVSIGRFGRYTCPRVVRRRKYKQGGQGKEEKWEIEKVRSETRVEWR